MLSCNETIAMGPLAYTGDHPGNVPSMQERFLGWNVPPEHSDLVHPHWRGFLAPPKYWHLSVALLYFMLMIMALVGNCCVVWIFSTSKALRTASNMFIVNLAVFDLVMTAEIPMLIWSSFLERMIGWDTGCDIYAFLGAISGTGQSITNAAIAFDRYRTISCPIDGRLNSKQAAVIVLLTWFWASPFSFMALFQVWGRYTTEGYLTTCSVDFLSDDQDTKVFVVAIFTWNYVIPMLLIIYFYSQLIVSIRNHERMLREQAKKMNVKSLVSNQDKERSVELRIAKVAFTIFFLFLLAWTPYATVSLTAAFGDRNKLTPHVTMLPAIFAKAVSCIDPWIYAINHPRYRQELQKRCKWMGIHEPEPTHDAASAQTEKLKSDEA